ncbi:hypothetical protein RDABS01_004546 [Bienertia sinuspersici]
MPQADSADYAQWGIVNSMLVAWIYNTLDVSIRSTIRLPDDAKTMWDDLQAQYSIGNGPCNLELKSKIGTSAVEFVKLQECELLHQFYIGLDSKKFGSVVSTLLRQDPLLSLNVAYSRIIADERKQLVSEAHSVDRSTTVGYAVQASTTQAQSSRPLHVEYTRPKCNHCGRFGHDREHCCDLHGYPAGSRGRGSARGGCRIRGTRGSSNGRSFAANTSRGRSSAVSEVTTEDRAHAPTLSDE